MSQNNNALDMTREALRRAEEKVLRVLPKIPLRVVVAEEKESTIPELGISGQFIKADSALHIWVDGTNSHLEKHLEEEVTRTYAHEYMHAFREQVIPWEGGTFLASIVSEGLSQSFELEIWKNGKLPLYAAQLSESELEECWKRVQPMLHDFEYDFEAWFFGSEKQNIKRWTAYGLGFWLVQRHMKQSGKKPSELGQEPAEAFVGER